MRSVEFTEVVREVCMKVFEQLKCHFLCYLKTLAEDGKPIGYDEATGAGLSSEQSVIGSTVHAESVAPEQFSGWQWTS